jgi:hypothetical protein
VLNIAGAEYDFAQVVFVILEECEHRRRGWDDELFAPQAMATAREKLGMIKAAYDEFGGSASYWEALQKEVLEVVMPQYIDEARAVTAREKHGFGVWRDGDPAARAASALTGLIIGSLIIAMPWIKIVEDVFAFALTGFLLLIVQFYLNATTFLIDPAVLPLVMLLVSLFGFVLTPVLNTYIRTAEQEADMYGLNASRQPDGFAGRRRRDSVRIHESTSRRETSAP